MLGWKSLCRLHAVILQFVEKYFLLNLELTDNHHVVRSQSIVKKKQKNKKSVILKMIFCSNFFFRQYFSTRFFLNHKYSSWNVQKWGRIGKIDISGAAIHENHPFQNSDFPKIVIFPDSDQILPKIVIFMDSCSKNIDFTDSTSFLNVSGRVLVV